MADVEALGQAIAESRDRLDVLINNAVEPESPLISDSEKSTAANIEESSNLSRAFVTP